MTLRMKSADFFEAGIEDQKTDGRTALRISYDDNNIVVDVDAEFGLIADKHPEILSHLFDAIRDAVKHTALLEGANGSKPSA